MTVYFITGNANKLKEIQKIIPNVEQLEVDLPEIQSNDPKEIITAKLEEARKLHPDKTLFCEDTSLYFDCLGNLPGPMIKFWLKELKYTGLADLVHKYENHAGRAVCWIGLVHGDRTEFFKGELKGTIVLPTAEPKFGWDPIFQPEGHTKTFADMSTEEKNEISHRKLAATQLKSYIDSNNL